jgi:predicted  nucleic acid-binding Zn-ribbon protein
MMMMMITMRRILMMMMNTCKRCGHEWASRVKKPASCPACKSYKWSEAKDRPRGLPHDDILDGVPPAKPKKVDPDPDWGA